MGFYIYEGGDRVGPSRFIVDGSSHQYIDVPSEQLLP